MPRARGGTIWVIWIWKRGVLCGCELPVLVLGAWDSLARRFGDLDQAQVSQVQLIVFPKRGVYLDLTDQIGGVT